MRTLRNGGIWVRGHVMTLLLIGGVTGLISLGTMWSMRMPSALAALVPDGNDVRHVMHRVGLFPESLAATGVTGPSVEAIVNSTLSYLSANYAQFLADESDVSVLSSRVARLTRAVQSGTRDQETLDLLQLSAATLATAEASRDSILEGVFSAATRTLDDAQVATLNTLRSQTGWTMPLEYLCAARTESELLDLRNAVAHRRIAEDDGEDVDRAVEAVLDACEAERPVIAARVGLDTHLASVRRALATHTDF